MTDDQIINLLEEEISGAEQIQEDLSTKREDYYKRFRSEPYGNEREGWSQSIAPVIWNTVESLLPSFIEVFRGDFFILKSDNEEKADKFRKLIQYQMFRKQDGTRKLYDFIFTLLLNHYAVFKNYYKEDYDLVSEKYARLSADDMLQIAQDKNTQITKFTEAETELGEPFYEDVKVVKKNIKYAGPYFECLPLWEFFFSKDCKITDWGAIEGKLVFHRVKRTLDYIRKKEKAGVYAEGSFARCKEKSQYHPTQEEEATYKYNSDDRSEPSDTTNYKNELAQEVTIDECYFMMDIDNDGLLEPCIIDKCEDIILRKEENPYGRPCFRIGSLNPEPHKVTGIPLADILDNDQKVLTNLLRLIQDTGAQSCYRNPVTNDHQMFTQLIDRKPFAVIKGDPQKLGEVKMTDPSQYILKAYEMLKGEIEEKTGVTRYNQGLDADSLNKTATGITQINQASTKKQKLAAILLGTGAVTGLIRDFIFINQKWPNDDPVKLLGQNLEVSQDDLSGEYDIEVDVGVGQAEKQQMANQLDLLIQFGTQAGIPMGIMSPMHLLKAQKKKYTLLDIKVDDCMYNEVQFQAEQKKREENKPKEDWKEFVAIDKLYPLLSRTEQAQILDKLGVQPDPNAQVAGLPSAKDLLTAQAKQGDVQSRMMENQQKMQMDKSKFQMDMIGKAQDLKHAKQKQMIDIMGKVADQKIKNASQSAKAAE